MKGKFTPVFKGRKNMTTLHFVFFGALVLTKQKRSSIQVKSSNVHHFISLDVTELQDLIVYVYIITAFEEPCEFYGHTKIIRWFSKIMT